MSANPNAEPVMGIEVFGVAEHACPSCGHVITSAMAPCQPKAGDVMLCAYCCAVGQFDEAMAMRLLTDEEWLDLPAELRGMIHEMVRELKEMREEGG